MRFCVAEAKEPADKDSREGRTAPHVGITEGEVMGSENDKEFRG